MPLPPNLSASIDARPAPGPGRVLSGGGMPPAGAVPAASASAGTAHWSPVGSLLAQLEAGDRQRLPRLDELPLDVRRQLAAVLASRLVAITQGLGLPAPAAAQVRADAQGRIEVHPLHPDAARLQAGVEADPLAAALVRYLHAPSDAVAGAASPPATDFGRLLPYVRGDELRPATDPARIPGHPNADAGRPLHALDGMRGVVWAVGAAIAVLVVASAL